MHLPSAKILHMLYKGLELNSREVKLSIQDRPVQLTLKTIRQRRTKRRI